VTEAVADARGALRMEKRPELLGGIVALRQRHLPFIPYYTFAKRGPTAMRVWIAAEF
jgi:DUF1680 family protein